MLPELKFSEARSNLTSVIDAAQRNQPTVIKPRKSSESGSILMTVEMLKALTDSNQERTFRFEILPDAAASTTISVEPFDIAVNGETREEAISAAVDDVIDYARDYFKEFPIYYGSKNRRSHLALVMKVLLCESKKEVAELIGFA